MTRWRVIAIGLVLSACEHGETPPPRCGDRVVDFGEQCDDGNEIADDGCDQCAAGADHPGRGRDPDPRPVSLEVPPPP
jgi:cysteine-rich repeat protein